MNTEQTIRDAARASFLAEIQGPEFCLFNFDTERNDMILVDAVPQIGDYFYSTSCGEIDDITRFYRIEKITDKFICIRSKEYDGTPGGKWKEVRLKVYEPKTEQSRRLQNRKYKAYKSGRHFFSRLLTAADHRVLVERVLTRWTTEDAEPSTQ